MPVGIMQLQAPAQDRQADTGIAGALPVGPEHAGTRYTDLQLRLVRLRFDRDLHGCLARLQAVLHRVLHQRLQQKARSHPATRRLVRDQGVVELGTKADLLQFEVGARHIEHRCDRGHGPVALVERIAQISCELAHHAHSRIRVILDLDDNPVQRVEQEMRVELIPEVAKLGLERFGFRRGRALLLAVHRKLRRAPELCEPPAREHDAIIDPRHRPRLQRSPVRNRPSGHAGHQPDPAGQHKRGGDTQQAVEEKDPQHLDAGLEMPPQGHRPQREHDRQRQRIDQNADHEGAREILEMGHAHERAERRQQAHATKSKKPGAPVSRHVQPIDQAHPDHVPFRYRKISPPGRLVPMDLPVSSAIPPGSSNPDSDAAADVVLSPPIQPAGRRPSGAM